MVLSDRSIREEIAAGRIVIDPFDDALVQEARRMGQLMHDAYGIGLAATQLGVMHRLLVYRTELAQAARRLGIHVTDIEVLRRLNGNSGGEEEQSADRFEFGTVKAQLLYERIYAKVTRKANGATIPERVARKNAAMKRYLDGLERETKVRYEPGYAPGP